MMGWRRIVVDGKPYRWRGKSFFVIQDENGKRVACAYGSDIKGIHPTEFDKGHWKRTSAGTVFPSEIEKFIRKAEAEKGTA